jgi:hypothetical protein
MTYRAKRNAKGIESLLPDAVIMAEETKGPMKADVFPICSAGDSVQDYSYGGDSELTTENSAKNRNLKV